MTEVTEHACTVLGMAMVEADTQANLRLPWELRVWMDFQEWKSLKCNLLS